MQTPEAQESLSQTARDNIRDSLSMALGYTRRERAMIVYDVHSALSRLLSKAYQAVLPDAAAFDFDQYNPESLLERFGLLSPGDLVVLLQSSSFRLSRFRIRIELFRRGLKVVEHPHLARIRSEEVPAYLDSLGYDPFYYRTVGPFLKEKIAHAEEIRIRGEGTELVYDSPFLDPKLNIGDYEGMKNIGGQFPIGEVFTEPEDLSRVNGRVRLVAFGDMDFRVHAPDTPFPVEIEAGQMLDSSQAPRQFREVLAEIREAEGVVWVRELGFGLNRAFSRERRVSDIGSYERMCGIHLSLGTKHLQYKKPSFPKKGGFHVDVFVEAQAVEVDGDCVFKDGVYGQGPLKLW